MNRDEQIDFLLDSHHAMQERVENLSTWVLRLEKSVIGLTSVSRDLCLELGERSDYEDEVISRGIPIRLARLERA